MSGTGHDESLPGDALVRVSVDLLIIAAEACEDLAFQVLDHIEGFDHTESDELKARGVQLRALAVEVSRAVTPPPASPAVTHTEQP